MLNKMLFNHYTSGSAWQANNLVDEDGEDDGDKGYDPMMMIYGRTLIVGGDDDETCLYWQLS